MKTEVSILTARASLARTVLLASTVVIAALMAHAAAAAPVTTIRVMLHPDAAVPGTFPVAQQQQLEAIAGTSLTLAGATRTGAVLLTLGTARDETTMAPLFAALRQDRSVLWVDAVPPPTSAPRAHKLASASPLTQQTGSRFMVRLNTDAAPDWGALLPQLSARVGATLSVVRSIGNVWVLTLANPVRGDTLAALAAQLQNDPSVRYADPVLRVRAQAIPNDPFFQNQWGLWDPVGGVNAPSAWDVTTGVPANVIAVIDTGKLPHAELAGRMLPGYDFISDPDSARDGDGRDPDPTDEGTWNDDGDCGGAPAAPSEWHGTYVSGIIAADTNNGSGISGMDWTASILPIRALGKCGEGTLDDIFAGMTWASGLPIDGVPLNPFPAKVINMSLGGYGACPQAIQEAIDAAMAQGSVVVVSAGNATDDASNYTPAGCGGVITVGASSRSGDRASYSNFGSRVDLSAPGGDISANGYNDPAGAILSLWNTGATTAQDDSYAYEMGTSASAPFVSGTVSLMLARNPTLTPGTVLSLLQASTRDFPQGTTCGIGNLCGTGLLDSGTALEITPSTAPGPPGSINIVEYYDAARDHYFITGDPGVMASLDSDFNHKYVRTGLIFYAYGSPFSSPYPVASVCQFHAPSPLIDSYYFTPDPTQCQYVSFYASATWTLQSYSAFYVPVPDSAGNCAAGTIPVYRFDNNRQDFNQRHTIDLSVRRAMVNRAWVPDGSGPRGAAFCSPI